MKKAFAFLVIAAIAVVGVIATPDEGSAVPAFARQTGNPCWACHFQYFPKLNAMGRNFKLNGFTDATSDMIEDEHLSVPTVFGVSYVSKLRYVKSSAKDSSGVEAGTDRGEIQIPDEAVLFFGGRAAENVGFSFEVGGGDWGNAKIMMPFVKGDVVAGLIFHTTDAHGPATAFELLNNGVLRAQRGFEMRKESYAVQKVVGGHESTGIGFYGGNDLVQVFATLWGPLWGVESAIDTGLELSQYVRITVTPEISENISLGFGIAYTGGESTCVDCQGEPEEGEELGEITIATTALTIDGQIQAEFDSGMTLEAGFTVSSAGDKGNAEEYYTDGEGSSVHAIVGVSPQLTVKAAYSTYTNNESGDDTNTIVVGVGYSVFQNIAVSLEYATYDGDGASKDNAMTLMLFSGF